MAIIWRDEMSIDGGVIDEDHQTLIAIINEFFEIKEDLREFNELSKLLAKLHHYTEVHFGREEMLQRAAHYPYNDAHHHEHETLLRELAAVNAELDTYAPVEPGAAVSPETLHAFHERVGLFLRHWLVDHIIKSDLRMKPFAAEMKGHAKTLKPLDQSVAWLAS
ncbi:MAG: hemerythrin family protein [Pseudomonadota bacterium]|jgi:hemerythrin